MEAEILEKLKAQEAKLDAIEKVVRQMRRYYLITMWVTVIFFVLPLVGLAFVIPEFINTYVGSLGGL